MCLGSGLVPGDPESLPPPPAGSVFMAHFIRKGYKQPSHPRLTLTRCWAVPGEGHCPPPSAYSPALSPRGGWPPSLPPPPRLGQAPGGAVPISQLPSSPFSQETHDLGWVRGWGVKLVYPLLPPTPLLRSIIISILLHPHHLFQPLRAEARAKSTNPQPLMPSPSSDGGLPGTAYRSHLNNDEVLQSNVLLHQELLSLGDKVHGSQKHLLVLCQVFLILRVRYCNWDLFLWKWKQRWELGVWCSFSKNLEKEGKAKFIVIPSMILATNLR